MRQAKLTLRKAPAPVRLDDHQRAVEAIEPATGNHLVLGVPGSGKTTAALALAVRRSAAGQTVLMLAQNRQAVNLLREAIPAGGNLEVQTVAGFADSIARIRASHLGAQWPLTVTGPDQIADLRSIIKGHLAGSAQGPQWPAEIPPEALEQDAFIAQLRDLFSRAAEAGMGPEDLEQLGREVGRETWVSAAAVMREYAQVQAISTGGESLKLDASAKVDHARQFLENWESDTGVNPPRWDLVVVDAYQEANLAQAKLLASLTHRGTQLVLTADPDTTTEGFRGADPALVARALTSGQVGSLDAQALILRGHYRGGPQLRAAHARVTARIPAVAGGKHRPVPAATQRNREQDKGQKKGQKPEVTGGANHTVEAAVAPSVIQEASLISNRLRRAVLTQGYQWQQCAVITRNRATGALLRHELKRANVPVAEAPLGSLIEYPVAADLLSLTVAGALGTDSEQTVERILRGPLGGADSTHLRRFTLGWQTAHLPADPREQSGQKPLLDALKTPSLMDGGETVYGPLYHIIKRLSQGYRAAAKASPANPHVLLSATWKALGLQDTWRKQALAGQAEAHDNLDVLGALMKDAEWWAERNHGGSIVLYQQRLTAKDQAEDSLAPRGYRGPGVEVLTPPQAAGRQWPVVIIAGLQQETWPNTRVRDTLLGAGALADLVQGRGDGGPMDYRRAQEAVIHDELRLFASAISRASEHLFLTAYSDEEVEVSPFMQLALGVPPPPVAPVAPAYDLASLVAELRYQMLEQPEGGIPRRQCAALLAHLARHGVRGAHPSQWAGMGASGLAAPHGSAVMQPGAEAATGTPEEENAEQTGEMGGSGRELRESPPVVSPSGIEGFMGCPLRWALERAGGRKPYTSEQNMGLLIHKIAEENPHGTYEQLREVLDERIDSLGLDEGWVGQDTRDKCENALRNLADMFAGRPGPVEVEYRVNAKVGPVFISGIMDRLEHLNENEVRIVDIKTGSAKSIKEVEKDPQLTAYQLAVENSLLTPLVQGQGAERKKMVVQSAQLAYVANTPGPRAKPIRNLAELTPETREDFNLVLQDLADAISGGTYAATPGDACRHCKLNTSCPAKKESHRVSQ